MVTSSMAIINYLLARFIIFTIVCFIWMFITGRYAQAESTSQHSLTTMIPIPSTETESLGEIRPVNLLIINDETNEVAKKSVTAALKSMKKENSDLIGNVITITVTGRDLTSDMEKICKVWDAAIEEDSSKVPDLVLDTTRAGYGAETVSAFTAAVGIPTLSSQFSQDEDKKNWRYLDADQNKYLVQVVQPLDLMPEVLRQLTFQMNISNVGIIFDESFTMEHKYNSLFANIPSKLIIQPTKQSSDEIRRILLQFQKRYLFNYFVLGNEKTIKLVMSIGQSLNLTGRNFGWYALTEQDFDPRWDLKNVSMMIFKPLITSVNLQRFVDLGLSMESPLTSAFYYDLVQLGTRAMNQSIARGKWPMNPAYFNCDTFDGENTPIRQFDYLESLVDVCTEFRPTIAGIIWGRRNDRHRVKFNMRVKLVTIVDGNITSDEDIGIWQAKLDSKILFKDDEAARQHSGIPKYRITTVIKAPFVMYDPKTKVWSGYSIDVINAIASSFNFSYVIHEAYDKQFGSIDKNGRWNGMIRELQDDKADIALSTLSIMAERSTVVDFTLPYYDLVGLSILMKKPRSITSLFKFLSVFDDDVWLCIMGCYFFSTLLMWILNRFSPYSDRNNCNESLDDDQKNRVFNFLECLWFSMTSLTPQGGGEAPMNWSGRVVAGTWWLFGFIIIASYTANLAAFLTVTRLETSVQSLEELSNQYKVQYAPINGSEAHVYFERMARIEKMFDGIWQDMNMNISMNTVERAKLAIWDYPVSDKYTKILEAMKLSGFPKDMDEALKRIRHISSIETNEFALIGDATDIRYLEMTNCDLLMVGSEFSQKPYAMAVQRGSFLKDIINAGLLELMKIRILEILKNRWWEENPKREICDDIEEQTHGISIVNIGGVFIVVLVGIILGCLILAFEYYWYKYRPKHDMKLIRMKNFKTGVKNPLPIKFTIKPAKNAIQSDQVRYRF